MLINKIASIAFYIFHKNKKLYILFFFLSVSSVLNNTSVHLPTSELVGCPQEYGWCHKTPQIKLIQMIMGMVFLSVGYPFILVITTTIYSKILGPRPQVN